MTVQTENATAQKLLDAFTRFRRLNRKQTLVGGLTPGEIMVLTSIRREMQSGTSELCEGPGIKVSEISGLLNVASPTITQQINNLEAQGLVERTMDKEDRRVVRVRLTDKGEQVVRKAFEAFLARFVGLVEYMGEEESNQLADLLTRAFAYLDEAREAHTGSFRPENRSDER
jgi:DNA-binding MarR family transcriptional regulator